MDGYSLLEYASRADRDERRGRPPVLVTLLRSEGHSYRKPGAMLLILTDGRRIGTISPGCLEADLGERAFRLADSGEPELATYDLRPDEDPTWGEELGCGGVLSLWLEPLSDETLARLAEARRAVDEGISVEWTRRLAGGRIAYGWRIAERGGIASGAETDREDNLLFSTRFVPRPRLFLFGADDASLPVARLASGLGFRLAVGDWRDSRCNADRYPGAELAVGPPAALAQRLRLGSEDYAIVGSHHLRRDREMLETLLALRPKPAYIGAIGSKRRIARLFDGLEGTEAVRSPAGLAIGAEGPEEIAVSLAAELIAERSRRRRREGGGVVVYRGDLFGGGAEHPNGRAEAGSGACAR